MNSPVVVLFVCFFFLTQREPENEFLSISPPQRWFMKTIRTVVAWRTKQKLCRLQAVSPWQLGHRLVWHNRDTHTHTSFQSLSCWINEKWRIISINLLPPCACLKHTHTHTLQSSISRLLHQAVVVLSFLVFLFSKFRHVDPELFTADSAEISHHKALCRVWCDVNMNHSVGSFSSRQTNESS